MSENSESSEKTAIKLVEIKIPEEIYRLIQHLAAAPNDNFSFVYGEDEQIAEQNLLNHLVLQRTIETGGFECIERRGIELSDYNMKEIDGRLRMLKQFNSIAPLFPSHDLL